MTEFSGPNPIDSGAGAVLATSIPESPPTPTSPWGEARPHVGDRISRRLAQTSGVLIIVVIAAIAVFLLGRAAPALRRNRENFFS